MTLTQTQLDANPYANYVVLVTLTYGGTPTVQRYCTGTDDVVDGSETFTVVAKMSVKSAELSGSAVEKPWEIVAPDTLAPFDEMFPISSWEKIQVKIEECDPLNPSNTRRVIWYGRIGNIKKDPNNKKGYIRAKVDGIKASLKIRSGTPALIYCVNSFGDTRCTFNRSTFELTGTVTSVDVGAKQVVCSLGGSNPDDHYKSGSIEVDGRSITIRKQVAGSPGTFKLYDTPPASWATKACTVQVGCNKKLKTCQDVWANEANYNGLGISMPYRNPSTQRS